MAQNEPQHKETPPGPSPNTPSLLFEHQCRSGKFIRLASRIESKLFCPNSNALFNSGQQECGTAAYTQTDLPRASPDRRLISAIALLTILHYGVRRYSTPAGKEEYCYERVCLSVCRCEKGGLKK